MQIEPSDVKVSDQIFETICSGCLKPVWNKSERSGLTGCSHKLCQKCSPIFDQKETCLYPECDASTGGVKSSRIPFGQSSFMSSVLLDQFRQVFNVGSLVRRPTIFLTSDSPLPRTLHSPNLLMKYAADNVVRVGDIWYLTVFSLGLVYQKRLLAAFQTLAEKQLIDKKTVQMIHAAIQSELKTVKEARITDLKENLFEFYFEWRGQREIEVKSRPMKDLEERLVQCLKAANKMDFQRRVQELNDSLANDWEIDPAAEISQEFDFLAPDSDWPMERKGVESKRRREEVDTLLNSLLFRLKGGYKNQAMALHVQNSKKIGQWRSAQRNSEVIKQRHVPFLSQTFQNFINVKLFYRVSEEGANRPCFDQLYESIPQILVLVKAGQNGAFIFGGFPDNEAGRSLSSRSSKALLFSLNTYSVYPVDISQRQSAFEWYKSGGPIFGSKFTRAFPQKMVF